MNRTPEEQYLHELIESYVVPLRSEIKALRKELAKQQDKVKKLTIPDVSNNEAMAVLSDGVSVAGCPYRIQDSCNFMGMCFDETCNIRAKPATNC